MTKNYILILIMVLFLFGSCEKAPEAQEVNTPSFIHGWEITKDSIDFYILPRDLFFIDSKTGFMVGTYGYIYKTINAGKSWQKQNSGTELELNTVYFINENIGFASGKAAINCSNEDCDKGAVFLKTTNGGETWTKKLFKDYVSIKSLHFFNESRGLAQIYVANSGDHIAKTENGGDSWEFIDLALKRTTNRVFYIDNEVFVTGENQKIYKSSDSGDNWETINTPLPSENAVSHLYFYNSTLGFINAAPDIYKTTDGGINWETVDIPFSSSNLFHFYNEKEGFMIHTVSEYDGGDFPTTKGIQSFQTLDGGKTWNKSELNDTLYLGLTCFPERGLGYGLNYPKFYTIKRK